MEHRRARGAADELLPPRRRYAGREGPCAYRRDTLAAVVRGACQRDRARLRPALGRVRRRGAGRPRVPALGLAAVPRGRVRAPADRALRRGRGRRPHRRAAARRDARRPAAQAQRASSGARLSSLPRTPMAGPLARDRHGGRGAARGRGRARAGSGRARGSRSSARRPTSTGSSPESAARRGAASYVLALPDDPDGAALRQLAQPRPDQVGGQQGGQGRGARYGWPKTSPMSAPGIRSTSETMREVVVPPRPLRLFEAMWRELAPQRPDAPVRRRAGRGEHARRVDRPRARAHRLLRVQRQASQRARRCGRTRCSSGRRSTTPAGAGSSATTSARSPAATRASPSSSASGAPTRCRCTATTTRRPSRTADDGDGEDGLVKRAATSVWPRLPLASTRLAGDLAYRWL